MSRAVKFSFDTEENRRDFEAYARSKGMTLSELAKVATFAYRAKNRAGSHHLLRQRDGEKKEDAQK